MERRDKELFNDIACILRAIGKGQHVEWRFALTVFEDFEAWRREERAQEGCICHELKRLNEFLRAAKSFQIKQIGGSGMAITGIVLGQTGTFTETPDPSGSSLQPGNIPQWSADDPNVSLTATADGTAVNVATSTSDTATSFNLTVSGVNSAGAAISTTVNVPLLPPAQVPAQGFVINQTA